jgi:hypothetical protein
LQIFHVPKIWIPHRGLVLHFQMMKFPCYKHLICGLIVWFQTIKFACSKLPKRVICV